MTTFKTIIRGEGASRTPMALVPAALRMPIGWARVAVSGTAPCFLYVRGAGRRFALPVWNFPDARVGDSIEVEIEPAEPYRVQGVNAPFDWNAFVDDHTFATEEPGGVLRLWSRYSAPFNLLRCPPREPLYRLLGFYQAEGSKGKTGNDFSFANTNVELLRNVIETLKAIGVGAEQLYAEILQGVGESRESAMATYASLGLEVTAVRPRSGRGGSAYVVHAHNSKPFRGMVCRALRYIFENEFPSKAEALAYTLGWLDGDGSVTWTGTDMKLRLAGLEDEHTVVKRALTQVFGWDLSTTHYKDNKRGSSINLKASRLIELLDVDAFPFSMSRVRLLLGLDHRTQGAHVAIARMRYAAEIEKARWLLATEPEHFGVKGTPLPSQFRLGKAK